MFRVVSPPIISSTNNCIYSIWYRSTVVVTCRYLGGVDTLNSATRTTGNKNNNKNKNNNNNNNNCLIHQKHVGQFMEKLNCV